jgi:hypothetical protein
MTNDQSPPRKTFPMQIPTAFTEQQQQQHKQMNMHMQSPPYPRFPTTSNSYRERSQSLSTPPPSLILPTSIPLTASPVMPFLPTLSMPSDSISMSPGRGSKHWPIDPDNIIPPTTTSFAQKNQKAVNNAIAAEKARVKEMERKENEADLSISDLKLILKRERSRSTKIIGELTLMKSISVASQAEAEVCEEGRINGLMRRVDCLQKEKGRIILELEREEEMVRIVFLLELVLVGHIHHRYSFYLPSLHVINSMSSSN